MRPPYFSSGGTGPLAATSGSCAGVAGTIRARAGNAVLADFRLSSGSLAVNAGAAGVVGDCAVRGSGVAAGRHGLAVWSCDRSVDADASIRLIRISSDGARDGLSIGTGDGFVHRAGFLV